MKNTRGGKRAGAGRHKTDNPRIKSSVTIKPELYAWVKSQPESISNLVNDGLELLKNAKPH